MKSSYKQLYYFLEYVSPKYILFMIVIVMGWWNGKEGLFENNEIPHNKCSECGDYKEVSKKYINKISDEMITICYDCSKKRYIESLMVVSAIDGVDDL